MTLNDSRKSGRRRGINCQKPEQLNEGNKRISKKKKEDIYIHDIHLRVSLYLFCCNFHLLSLFSNPWFAVIPLGTHRNWDFFRNLKLSLVFWVCSSSSLETELRRGRRKYQVKIKHQFQKTRLLHLHPLHPHFLSRFLSVNFVPRLLFSPF